MAFAHHLANLWLPTILVVNVNHFCACGALRPVIIESNEFFAFLLPHVAVKEAEEIEEACLEYLAQVRVLHLLHVLALQYLLDDRLLCTWRELFGIHILCTFPFEESACRSLTCGVHVGARAMIDRALFGVPSVTQVAHSGSWAIWVVASATIWTFYRLRIVYCVLGQNR